METTIVYWGNIGIMENQMEANIMGLYWVLVKIMVPFWVYTLYIRCRIIIEFQKGTIILTSTHMRITENTMETTIGFRVLGFRLGLHKPKS